MDIDWQGSPQIDASVEHDYSYLSDFPRHCYPTPNSLLDKALD